MGDKKTKKQVKKKRNRNSLTFYEKIAVIRHHDVNQISRNSLARMFQCCSTQIRRILERKDELLAQWKAMSEKDATVIYEEMAKKRREFEMEAVTIILHQWVERCRHLELNMIINNETLTDVASKMATVLNLPDFRASSGWISKFRRRFKYKGSDLAKPRSADDPPGSLSVEDIIIEYKHYLPSFLQQEISNITSSSLRDSDVSQEGSPIPTDEQEDDPEVPLEYPHAENFPIDQLSTNIENVLRNFTEIELFLQHHSDFRGMAMLSQLVNHVKTNYDLTQLQTIEGDDHTDDIILIE